MSMLGSEQVEKFVRDGFVPVSQAFPRSVAQQCRELLWEKSGLDPEDPGTWTQPVVRIGGCVEEPFVRAANTAALHSAYDQLVGVGRWVAPEALGTFPIRFPRPGDPGDTGWHLDGSYAASGEQWPMVNLRSHGRALLMLFLLSDIGPDDAPTLVKAGSHRDVPPFLVDSGDPGIDMLSLCQAMDRAGKLDAPEREVVAATGRAGDVYLCHPFLIHRAQEHRGRGARLLAQPPLGPVGDLVLDGAESSPVEIAVREALSG